MFDNKEAGKRIRKRRLELGIEINVFASLVGISEAFLGLVETGNRFVSTNNLIKISQVLGVSTDYILKGSGEVKELDLPKQKIVHITQNILTDEEAEFFIDICLALKECKCKIKELKWICLFISTYLVYINKKTD